MADVEVINVTDYDEESVTDFDGLDPIDTNSIEIKQEQNEWIRHQLTDLWGESKAEYFLNPSIAAKTHQSANDQAIKEHVTILTKRNQRNNNGMFAYLIWDNIRNDSKKKAKLYDLPKELQEKMDTFMKSAKLKSGISEQNKKQLLASSKAIDAELAKHSRVIDMSKLNKTKILRNEIELMYRSSKMNEERMMLMRTNSPLPDLNDLNGKESIIRYLPSINLHNDIKSSRLDSSYSQNSSSGRFKKTTAIKNESASFNLIDSKQDSNSKRNKIKYETVKLHFLTERSHKDYLNNKSKEIDESQQTETDTIEISNSIKNIKPEEKLKEEQKEDILKPISYPPLTMNALMEYKPLLKAPGAGEFDNGRPKLFKCINDFCK